MKQYLTIASTLRQQIVRGAFPVGSRLPSENELCLTYQTSRMTVRQALGELVRDGFIERHHGKGSVVTADRQALGLLSFRGFSEVVRAGHHSVRTEFLAEPSQGNWPEPFFFPLSTAERAGSCLWLQRLRFADESPVMLEHTYLPAAQLPGLLTEGLVDGSLFRTLSIRHQLDILSMEQSLRAVSASPAQTAVFACAPHTPLIYIERRYFTNRPDVFVYSQLYCHTEQYAVSTG